MKHTRLILKISFPKTLIPPYYGSTILNAYDDAQKEI